MVESSEANPEQLRVRLNQSYWVTLWLEGAVLIMRRTNHLFCVDTWIPAERLLLDHRRAVYGRPIVVSILLGAGFFFALLVLWFLESWLWEEGQFVENRTSGTAVLLMLGFFALALVLAFFRRDQVIVKFDGTEWFWFWQHDCGAPGLTRFRERLSSLRQRAHTFLESHPPDPVSFVRRYSPWHMGVVVVFVVFLFALPAIVTSRVNWLWPVLVPLAYYAVRGILHLGLPKDIRAAQRASMRGELDRAVELILPRVEHYADPRSVGFLIDIEMRRENFDRVLTLTAKWPDSMIEARRRFEAYALNAQRLHARRLSRPD